MIWNVVDLYQTEERTSVQLTFHVKQNNFVFYNSIPNIRRTKHVWSHLHTSYETNYDDL